MKVFVIDKARCNGCHGCQLACKDEHCGNDWMPYQKPQPEVGHFWMKVNQITHGQTPKVKVEYTPTMCQHCDNPACLPACPQEAISKREDGLVCIDPAKCVGCKSCMEACPYDVIYHNEECGICQKCDGCAHLVDGGEIPHCVDMCATEAIRFGEEEDFAEEIAKATTMLPEAGCRPRVYYLNEPGLFIGGEVWDPIDDEIIEGATITLTGDAQMTATSDSWGDFWFKKLAAGSYHVAIACEGYEGVELDVELDKSLNIGDFPLKRA